ncbi:MAG: SMI1/KNR4 family protein [Phycisphaerae bacterium]|nr:SMI1/KNR4 family protein [Phycisphaerae bacterium]
MQAKTIAAAAEALGVTLPDDYQAFLRRFGHCCIGDFAVYGLGSKTPPDLNVVERTQEERRNEFLPLPPHLVVLWRTPFGDLHCLDTSQLANGVCPVVLWSHEYDEHQEPGRLAFTFADWLEEQLDRLEEGHTD